MIPLDSRGEANFRLVSLEILENNRDSNGAPSNGGAARAKYRRLTSDSQGLSFSNSDSHSCAHIMQHVHKKSHNRVSNVEDAVRSLQPARSLDGERIVIAMAAVARDLLSRHRLVR